MSIRQATRRVAVTVAAVSAAGAFSVVTLSGTAGAAAPTEGQIVPGSLVAQAPVTAGAPFSSGQQIDIVIPANSLFVSTTSLNVVECSAPNGVIPTSPSACDGNTIQGQSLFSASDGSVDFQSDTGSLYPVYATPDSNLGDTTSGPKCGNTAATECILYVGDNQNDFTANHVWSSPFFVAASAGDQGANPGDGTGTNPGTGTPEVPLAILLPVAAIGLLGGTVLIRRRRSVSRAMSDA
jgi:hypothetical protein